MPVVMVQIFSETVPSLKYFVEQSTSVETYFKLLLVKFKQRLHLFLSVCVKTFRNPFLKVSRFVVRTWIIREDLFPSQKKKSLISF